MGQLTLIQKHKLYEYSLQHNDLNQSELAEWVEMEFKIKINKSSVGRILKSFREKPELRNNIFLNHGNVHKRRRLRQAKYPELDQELAEWYKNIDDKKTITEKTIIDKAKLIRDKLNIHSDLLKLSNGWIGKWKIRHNVQIHNNNKFILKSEKNSLQSKKSVIGQTINNSSKNDIVQIIRDNKTNDSDIQSVDVNTIENVSLFIYKINLFYRIEPNKEGIQTRTSNKKELITLIVAYETTETIEIPIYIIGNITNPKCFRNINLASFPIRYINYSNSIIHFDDALQIFYQELNKKLSSVQRNGNLYLNEHISLSEQNKVFSNLNFNTTKPLNIEKIFKTYYRLYLLEYIKENHTDISETCSKHVTITLLECLEWILYSWDQVKHDIQSFTTTNNNSIIENNSNKITLETEMGNNIIKEMNKTIIKLNYNEPMAAEEYVSFELRYNNKDNIINRISYKKSDNDNDNDNDNKNDNDNEISADDDSTEYPIISINDAESALKILRIFSMQQKQTVHERKLASGYINLIRKVKNGLKDNNNKIDEKFPIIQVI